MKPTTDKRARVAHPRTAAALRTCARPFFAVVFMCACFTAAASLVLLYILAQHSAAEERHLFFTTGIKAGVFTLLTALSLWGLRRCCRRPAENAPYPQAPVSSRFSAMMGLCLVLIVAAGAMLPRLDVYPWTAPDEMHHLIVARNLAEYGLYASGNPTAGFTLFDSYDSVGAPVIAPIAAVFHMLGTSTASARVEAARVVIAVYYLLLCAGLYLLLLPAVGPAPAAFGLFLATIGYGSIYLGRTLYGEAPALAYFVWGLLAWRHAAIARPLLWSALAGLAFGLAILCKTILVLAAFAFLTVAVIDFFGDRRLKWAQLVAPAITTPAVILAWWAIQAFTRHNAMDTAGDTLGLYKHYLMFGIGSLDNAVQRFATEPFMAAAMGVTLVSALTFVTTRRYDVALAVLALLAVFFLFWWIFFTPCQIARYAWWTYALAAAFGGRLVFPSVKQQSKRRWLAFGMLALLLLPPLPSAARELWLVYRGDEMRDDYALARYIETLSPDTHIATTYWPIERSVNFFSTRRAAVIDAAPADVSQNPVIIVDEKTQPQLCQGRKSTRSFGRYVIMDGGLPNTR